MTKEEYIEKYGEEAYQKRLERTRKWNKEHKEKNRERVKKWYQEHLEKRRDLTRNSDRRNKCMFAFVISEEKEQIDNYELALKDDFKGWTIHHRLETHNSDGELRPVSITADELKALNMYYNRPASELIFLTRSEHMKLHRSKN